MNLYEITDIKTGKVIEPAGTLKQVTKKLKCSKDTISGAYYGNYAIRHRYTVEVVDIAIAKRDPIWVEWNATVRWLINICKEGKKSK